MHSLCDGPRGIIAMCSTPIRAMGVSRVTHCGLRILEGIDGLRARINSPGFYFPGGEHVAISTITLLL